MSNESQTDASQQKNSGDNPKPKNDEGPTKPATILVRGEAIADQSRGGSSDSSPTDRDDTSRDQKVSEAKAKLQSRLPALDDDSDVGVQKEHVVVRDGQPDLAFTGALLASAAPTTAPKGEWQEYRIYETSAGKHVFSKITKNVAAATEDKHEAEVFDPEPSSTSAQLLKRAHDLLHTRPVTWTDSAVKFFGYDPLAKELYRKFGPTFEQHVG